MSADEDTELRDLVAQTLETNGVLGKIRAQLRASVFLALEEQESVQSKTPFLNKNLQDFLSTKDGQLVGNLVKEFLEHFHLDYSIAVFDPETSSGVNYEGRNKLARDLDIIESDTSEKLPLLAELVKRGRGEKVTRTRLASGTESSSPRSSTSSSSTESKNQKNTASSDTTSNKGALNGDRKDSPRQDSLDDDSFFDDPVPTNDKTKAFTSEKKQDKKEGDGAPSMSSLAGLPSLSGGGNKAESPRTVDLDKDIKAIDKKIADLGFDLPDDDDYDEDFDNSSNASPVSKTPRSGRSFGDSKGKSFDDDIEEDIEEDLSVGEDFLKSDNSGMDDLTTDRTVSPTEQSAAFDYMEDVISP